MLKVALKNELDKDRNVEKSKFDGNAAVQAVKLLMNEDGAEDLRILRGLGTQHSAIKANDALGARLDIEKLTNAYAGEIYTKAQIKALAIKYNLKFLNSTRYKGNLDVQVVAEIKKFAKSTNTNISDVILDRKFFILAPKENFMVDKKEEIVVVDRDPIMFYKIDDNHFRFIHKWGNDFSPIRLISGFKHKNEGNFSIVKMLEIAPLVFFLMALIWPLFLAASPIIFFSVFSIVSLLTVGIIVFGRASQAEERKTKIYSEQGWDNFEQTKTTYR